MLNKITKHLLPFGLMLMTAMGFATQASAEFAPEKQLIVIEGYDISEAVLAGNYEEAIEFGKQKKSARTAYDRAANSNSLCVAHAKLANLEEAIAACRTAARATKYLDIGSELRSVVRSNQALVMSYADE